MFFWLYQRMHIFDEKHLSMTCKTMRSTLYHEINKYIYFDNGLHNLRMLIQSRHLNHKKLLCQRMESNDDINKKNNY